MVVFNHLSSKCAFLCPSLSFSLALSLSFSYSLALKVFTSTSLSLSRPFLIQTDVSVLLCSLLCSGKCLVFAVYQLADICSPQHVYLLILELGASFILFYHLTHTYIHTNKPVVFV